MMSMPLPVLSPIIDANSGYSTHHIYRTPSADWSATSKCLVCP